MRLNKFNKKLKKEYEDTINEDKTFFQKIVYFLKNLKLRHYLLAAASFLFAFLIIQHIAVIAINNHYNNKINEITAQSISQNNGKLNKIENENQYKKLKVIKTKYEKYSALDVIFDILPHGCASKDATSDGGNRNNSINSDTITSINTANGNSYNTNVQTAGIDEADIAKCDGKFIYSISDGTLYVFNLNGDVLDKYSSSADELYLYKQKIILIDKYDGITVLELIYENNEYELKKLESFDGRVCLSRLKDNMLYLVLQNSNFEDDRSYDNLYCADYLFEYNNLYTLVSYNLDSYELKEADVVNGGNSAIVYMSNEHIYVSARYNEYKTITSIAIFDLDINPVGMVNICGTIKNQFSMDEYNGYLRVVATDSSMENERLNSISIFNLSTLELTGFLNEGIGIGRQTIRSVRFDKEKCYAVTYLTQDPLYEIDCSDVTNPVIKSQYEAPGYSSYLHNFIINDQSYLIGLGYDDIDLPKISVYKNEENGTTQIGNDFIIGPGDYEEYLDIDVTYEINRYKHDMFNNHKAMFFYNDNEYLYVGFTVNNNKYLIVKIDVLAEEDVVSVYMDIRHETLYDNETRCFMVDYVLYIPVGHELLIKDFNVAN